MHDKQLLNDKFMATKLPQICAPRRDLLRVFGRESEKRVIFVSAPAGYGKTISTRLWLSSTNRKTIWISLDEYDDAPAVFYRLFCSGIASVQPDNQAMMDILKSPTFASSPVEHTIRLLSAFFPEDEQYALVLDDVHLLTNKEIRKSGLLVQKRLPLSFVTLILTRNEIADEYISSVGEEKCAVITAKDLAFSTKEIQEYFMKCGRTVTEKAASEVRELTNGWAIGVSALAKSGQIKLANGGHILENYIKEEIWDKWSQELRDFMRITAVVDEMTPELCNMLTGREDSRSVLDNLCNSNALTTKISEEAYRYHHLFLDFLRHMWDDKDSSFRALNQLAADYYIQTGEYLTARRYAIRCGDAGTITKVAHQLFQYRSASIDEFANSSKLYEVPSDSVCDKIPFLYARLMWENYLRGNAEQMEHYMDKTYQCLPTIMRDFPQDAVMVLMEISLDHRVSIFDLIDQFERLLPFKRVHETQQGVSVTHEMPFMHRSNRNYVEMIDETIHERVRSVFGKLFIDVDIIIKEMRSGLLLEQNMLRSALEVALDTYESVNESTSVELQFCALIHLAAIHFALGNPNYHSIIAKTESLIESNCAYYLRPNFFAFKIKNLLFNANMSAASSWLDHYFVVATEHLELYKIYQHFVTARAYMVVGEIDKAMHYIHMLKRLAADFRRPVDLAEAGALQAVLQWALGEKKEAQQTLEVALLEMQPYGFARVFADEGASILPILKKIGAAVDKKDYQGPLQSRFLHEVILAAYEQSKRYRGLVANWGAKPVKLSKQQKLILTLLSKGHKYNDIVDITELTIHTVKSHASAAYRKLNVHNSMDAILEARKMGFIE